MKTVINATQYAARRDQINQRHYPSRPALPALLPGRLTGFAPQPGGAQFSFENSSVEIVYLTPDLAQITWKPGLLPVPYAIANSEWPPIAVTIAEEQDGYTLNSDALAITVDNHGGLRFSLLHGPTLRTEQPAARRGESWEHHAAHPSPAAIFGLGERAAPLNRANGSYRLWNTDPGGSYGPGKDPIYICIPLYLAQHTQGSYLIFYENSFDGTIAFGAASDQQPTSGEDDGSGSAQYASASFVSGALRYYFIAGPIPAALARYTELTGRAGLPPRWALGYHQSRWGYRSSDEIRKVVAGFAENQMPLSAFHLDIDYMDGYRLFTVDPERFGDTQALVEELDAAGIKVVTILDCGVKKDANYPVYTSGLREKVFCTHPNGKPLTGLVWPGESVYPDFTNPHARDWWADQYPALLDLGVAGIWHDMNEPTSFAAWGDITLPLPTRHQFDGRGGDHREGHNLYGFLMARAGHEGLTKYRPNRRPWIITRSAWAGFQRYTWNWTGDTETSWASLVQTIPTVINLGLSGQPFSGPDIGGFSGSPSAELYTRWLQMATFLPFFRTHAAWDTPPREPWSFGEPYTSIVRKFLRLRYRLMPYLYTLAWEASRDGLPMIRPLCWLDWDDPALWAVDDEFLLGDDMLVAPVVEENGRSRKVVLPPGQWRPLRGGAPLAGPGVIEVAATLDDIPVFVRSGAIIPFDEDGELVLRAYPDADGGAQGKLYSDAGDGFGEWRVERFQIRSVQGTPELSRAAEGSFPLPFTAIRLELP